MNKLAELLGLLSATVGVFFLRIFVLCKLYDLIIVPFGGPHLKFWQVFALSYFVHAITANYDADVRTKSTGEHIKGLISTAVGCLLSWGIAVWMFH